MPAWNDLTEEQLTALPTHRLYTVYKLMVASRGYLSYHHYEYGDDNGHMEMNDKCEFVKAELDTRGHIEREKVPANTGVSERSIERRFGWLRLYNEHVPCVHKNKIEDLEGAIGKQVFKTSKKPFKSKNLYNTVKGITVNPHTKYQAFTFEEDDSIVDCHICKLRVIKEDSNA